MSHFQFPTLASNHVCNLIPLSHKNWALVYFLFNKNNSPLIDQHGVGRRAVGGQLPVACTWRDHGQLYWVKRVAGQQLSVEPSIDHSRLEKRSLRTFDINFLLQTGPGPIFR